MAVLSKKNWFLIIYKAFFCLSLLSQRQLVICFISRSLLIVISFICLACSSNPVNSREGVDLRELELVIPKLEQESKLTGRSLASVKIIPLETHPYAIVGDNAGWRIFNDHIVVFDKDQERILVFDRQGKYLSKIDRQGRGPNEYVYIVDFVFDEQQKAILIYDHQKVNSYTLDGRHLNTNKISGFTASLFVKLGDAYVFYADNHCNKGFCDNVIFCDRNFTMRSTQLSIPSQFEEIRTFSGRRLVGYNSLRARVIGYDDVIYDLSPDSIEAVERLSGVDDIYFKQDFGSQNGFIQQALKNPATGFIGDYLEDAYYRYFTLKQAGRTFHFIEDKVADKGFSFRRLDSELLGNRIIGLHEGKFYSIVSGMKLAEYTLSYNHMGEHDRHIIDKHNDVLKSIGEDSNPVLIEYRLNL